MTSPSTVMKTPFSLCGTKTTFRITTITISKIDSFPGTWIGGLEFTQTRKRKGITMSSFVVSKIGTKCTIKTVKNLGWILRNWKLVDDVQFHYNKVDSIPKDGMVEFYLKDGRKYFTDYASFDVFLNWIDRPIFRGLSLWISSFGKTFGSLTIGSGEFRKFRSLRTM